MKVGIKKIVAAALAVTLLAVMLAGCELDPRTLVDKFIVGNKTTADITGDFVIDPSGGGASFDSDLADKVLNLVNVERINLGLDPLVKDAMLEQTAAVRCEEMFENSYFEHTRPDGTKWYTAIEETGYKYQTIMENIQMGSNKTVTAQDVFDCWKNSPSHYEAMISPDVTHSGVAVYVRDNGRICEWYATEHFSKPMQ